MAGHDGAKKPGHDGENNDYPRQFVIGLLRG